MSSLNYSEKRKFEKLLGMGGGYVLDFSNSCSSARANWGNAKDPMPPITP